MKEKPLVGRQSYKITVKEGVRESSQGEHLPLLSTLILIMRQWALEHACFWLPCA